MNNIHVLISKALHVFTDPQSQWLFIRKVTRLTGSNKPLSGVYAFINKSNNKCYIGSSMGLLNRLKDYYQDWYISNRSDLLICKAILKYGKGNFTLVLLEVLEDASREDILRLEQKWIDEIQPEYNMLKTAGSPLGSAHTAESKMKMKAKWADRTGDSAGFKVVVTDTITGEVTVLPSIRAAQRFTGSSVGVIERAERNNNKKLVMNRYHVKVTRPTK